MTIYDLISQIEKTTSISRYKYLFEQSISKHYNLIDDKETLSLLLNFMTLHLDYKDKNALFQPRMIWENQRSFALDDLTKEQIEQ